MKAKVVPFRIDLRDSQNNPMGGSGRSTHVPHLSEILLWMREKTEGEEWERRKLAARGAGDAYMKLGFIWEIAVEDALAKYIRRQSEEVKPQREIIVDGIAMTIDARVKGSWQGIEEYKLTYRSERGLILAAEGGDPEILYEALEEHFWWYLAQVKGYCYGATIKFKKAFNKARLVVFFAMGDWSHGKTPHGFPHPHCFEMTFTAEALAENWIMVRKNLKAMQRERRMNAHG